MTFLSFLLVVMTFWHLRYKKMKTYLPSNVASSGNVQPCSSSTSSEHGSRLTYIIRDLSSLYLTSLRSSISYDPFSCSRCITISITIGNNLIYYSIICKISGIYASTMCGIFFFSCVVFSFYWYYSWFLSNVRNLFKTNLCFRCAMAIYSSCSWWWIRGQIQI